MTAKIKISNEADRLAVASILVKNGYTVRQFGKKPTGGSRKVYYLELSKDDDEKENDDEG